MKGMIFFDIGHTLVTGADVSPRRLIGTALGLTGKQVLHVEETIMTVYAETPEELAKSLARGLPDFSEKAILDVLKNIWEEQLSCIELIPGAEEIVFRLREMGYSLGLISNIWCPFFDGFVRKYPRVVAEFRYHILSYRVGKKKPSVDIYYTAAREAGRPPRECWMVGDTYELDMAPAMLAGFHTMWFVIRPEKEKESLVKVLRGELPRPEYAVYDIREIPRFFESQNGVSWCGTLSL